MSAFSGINKNIKARNGFSQKERKKKHPETKMNFSAFHSSFFLGGGWNFQSILINNFIEAWYICKHSVYLMFSSVSESCLLFATPGTAAQQASLSSTNCQNLLKLMSIKLVTPSNHLILCRLLFYLPLIFPSIRVFSNESVLPIGWSKYWSFSFSISPFNEYS